MRFCFVHSFLPSYFLIAYKYVFIIVNKTVGLLGHYTREDNLKPCQQEIFIRAGYYGTFRTFNIRINKSPKSIVSTDYFFDFAIQNKSFIRGARWVNIQTLSAIYVWILIYCFKKILVVVLIRKLNISPGAHLYTIIFSIHLKQQQLNKFFPKKLLLFLAVIITFFRYVASPFN